MFQNHDNYNSIHELKAVWDIFSEGVYITDMYGKTLEVNKAYEKITGIRRDTVIGRNIRDIVKEGILSNSITAKVIERQKVVVEHQMIMKTGKHVLIKGVPICGISGEVELVVTLVMDETVMKQMKDEVERSENLIRQYQSQLEDIEKDEFVAESKKFKEAICLAERVAHVDTTVLIRGESGTGKEIIAKRIHEKSHRSKQPFMKINCGAIPEQLLESELFGYESGAFTGARKGGHEGVFEAANKGTVFLDEIGDMPLILQVKILRVLQEKKIKRIGSNKDKDVDVRIVAATNCDLEGMIKEKKFRKDLYYRLNVVAIHLPPLRERKEEIPAFVNFFVKRLNEKYGFYKTISSSTIKSFMEYAWPGNVRELENKIEELLVTSDGEEVWGPSQELAETKKEVIVTEIMPLKAAMERTEQEMLRRAAGKYATTYEIAEALDISQPSASRKLKKYSIDINDSKLN